MANQGTGKSGVTSTARIVRVRTWTCRFALPRPFRLGRATVAEREYVIVRVETDSGLHGSAFALTRDAPVDVVLADLVAPSALADPASDPRAWRAARRHHAPEGLALRAESLLDVACWDLRGKLAGQPVWRLLGGSRSTAPVMLVEGYELSGEDDEGFAERLGRAAADGFSLLKVANITDEPERMTRRLRLVRERIGPDVGLTVDIGFGWVDLEGALETALGWSDLGLAWIEDPLHGHEVERLVPFRAAVGTPVAVGDEVTSQRTLAALVDAGAVDVLRVDATCAGGLSGALRAVERASGRGVGASTHIYPEIHRHLAFASAAAGPIEAFRADAPWDAPQAFSTPPATEKDPRTGIRVMRVPEQPGLGLEIDWERVEREAARTRNVPP